MSSVCFLGNSHLGAIKRGWDDSGRAGTFLAATGSRLEGLKVRDGQLVGDDELTEMMTRLTGTATTAVADHDAFVIVGLSLSVRNTAALFQRFRPWRADVEDGSTYLISPEAYAAAAAGSLRRSAAVKLAQRLRAATDVPILLMPQPGPSERVIETTSPKTGFWRSLRATGREREVREAFEGGCALVAGNELHVVVQPEATRAHEIFTLERFATHDTKLDGRERPDGRIDYSHMNAEFGNLAVGDLLTALQDVGAS
jgi:hypothetical protein